MSSEVKVGSISTIEPLGCHLQAIASVEGIFDWGSGAKTFDALLNRNHGQGSGYQGQYFTGTIVSVQLPHQKTEEALAKRGFVLLGTQKGAHGDYTMGLYGLGFQIPARPVKEKKATKEKEK